MEYRFSFVALWSAAIFPLTGYPPTGKDSWAYVFGRFKEHGLNHVRFHSWCPPEAAFQAADKLGFYLQVECGSWANQGSTIGDGGALDSFIYREGDRILEAYGNHPSFCMMAYGNEPAGENQDGYLGELVEYWKSKDHQAGSIPLPQDGPSSLRTSTTIARLQGSSIGGRALKA